MEMSHESSLEAYRCPEDLGAPPSESATMVQLTVDGKTVTVPEGTKVIRAAALAGINIPKLCASDTVLRADITERVQPGVVYTTFHHPESGANVVTTDNSDWATNCPEYKVTAVQAYKVTQLSDWQQEFEEFTETQLEFLRKARTPVSA